MKVSLEMYFILDTNVYFDQWLLKSPNLTLFANFLNNTKSTLLAPLITIEEVNNKYRGEVQKHIDSAKTIFNSSKGYLIEGSLSLPFEYNLPDYDIQKILLEKFDKVKFINYEDIPHNLLVNNAMKMIRPFTANEKGYRDSLLWHSIVNYLVSINDEKEVVFINKNYKDFFESAEEPLMLHKDLIQSLSINSIRNPFTLYRNLNDFNKQRITDTEIHNLNHQEFSDNYGDIIESDMKDIATEFLNEMSVQNSREMYIEGHFPRELISKVLSFSYEDYDGIEDPDITSITKVAGSQIHINYEFNMLNLLVDMTIPSEDYYSNKTMIDTYFYDADVDGPITTISHSARVYFMNSLIFDTSTKSVIESSVDNIFIKPFRTKLMSRLKVE